MQSRPDGLHAQVILLVDHHRDRLRFAEGHGAAGLQVLARLGSDEVTAREVALEQQQPQDRRRLLDVDPARLAVEAGLDERREDIPSLAAYFVDRIARASGLPKRPFSGEAMAALQTYHWPGNVRELENTITKAVLLADGGVITPEALRLQAPRPPKAATTRKEFEEEAHQKLLELLQLHEWNVSEVARSLGVARTTVYRRMRKFGLEES